MKAFIMLVVPAIITIAMVGAAIFITINHPDQTIPDFLVNSLTTILGYYFGVGVAKS
jgi:hypothetical protein